MALIKPGGGITDIRGKLGGVYFHRDKSGLHSSRRPRKIRRQTAAQLKQKSAFRKARAYSTDNRVVSYNIFRALNNLPMAQPPPDYRPDLK